MISNEPEAVLMRGAQRGGGRSRALSFLTVARSLFRVFSSSVRAKYPESGTPGDIAAAVAASRGAVRGQLGS